jgi:peptidoglycan/LPS O-acetylase OafA/YrhL
MRSSTGEHYIALDHVRALAAFLVFALHFTHAADGYPVPFQFVPAIVPFAIVDEGQTGVALFMTLSGYLFAKLLDGRSIRYRTFLWNRALRLVPLLAVVIVINGVVEYLAGKDLEPFFDMVIKGPVFPTLPNGGWSITVEFHYYLILPLFLWMLRRSKYLPLALVAAAIAARTLIHHVKGEVESLAYLTIVGRVDQFALGMIVYSFRDRLARRHDIAIAVMCAFALFYWWFDRLGGFIAMPTYPSPSPIWIYLPTIEGIAYAVGIAWYDTSFAPSTSGVSKVIGRLGAYSYSIYLLHFFVVYHEARFVNKHVMDISNFYVATAWALACFVLMLPIGWASFRFIESPFLKLRRRYVVDALGSEPEADRDRVEVADTPHP